MSADLWIYASLFLDAFVAATLLPAFSELALAALVLNGSGDPFWLFLAATLGNIGGSVLTYWMAHTGVEKTRWGKRLTAGAAYERSRVFFNRYGVWSLLFAWAPLIGDALVFVAGAMGVRFARFLTLISVGKAARYAAITLIALGF